MHWYPNKATSTFSDMLVKIRRASWSQGPVEPPQTQPTYGNNPPPGRLRQRCCTVSGVACPCPRWGARSAEAAPRHPLGFEIAPVKTTLRGMTIPDRRRAPWPYPWHALRDGAEVEVDNRTVGLSVVACGALNLDSGMLVVCDPFAGMMGGGGDPWIDTPCGRYPVSVTLAHVNGPRGPSNPKEAYVSLILRATPELTRENLCLCGRGQDRETLKPGEYWGVPVDSGTVCLVDGAAIDRDMPPPSTWYGRVFDSAHSDCWFKRMDDPAHIRRGIANVPLPHGAGSTNAVLVHSGWGDGLYPVIGGFDAEGHLVAVHVDFMVVRGLSAGR